MGRGGRSVANRFLNPVPPPKQGFTKALPSPGPLLDERRAPSLCPRKRTREQGDDEDPDRHAQPRARRGRRSCRRRRRVRGRPVGAVRLDPRRHDDRRDDDDRWDDHRRAPRTCPGRATSPSTRPTHAAPAPEPRRPAPTTIGSRPWSRPSRRPARRRVPRTFPARATSPSTRPIRAAPATEPPRTTARTAPAPAMTADDDDNDEDRSGSNSGTS